LKNILRPLCDFKVINTEESAGSRLYDRQGWGGINLGQRGDDRLKILNASEMQE